MKKRSIVAVLAGLLSGCAAHETLLFDVNHGTTARPHCTVVDDPFGGTGKVVVGEPVGKNANKTTFINGKGFFAIPAEWEGSVFIRLAVRGSRKLKVQMVAKGRRPKSYYPELPAEGKWCEVELPLAGTEKRIAAGAKVNDITVWHLDKSEGTVLYIQSARLVDAG